MDELDKLKSHWKKTAENFPKVSAQEIYGMIHKKSSSIVKWILIISILEFIFFLILPFLLSDSANVKEMEGYFTDYALYAIYIIDYIIIVYFIYLFYRNFKKIKSTDTVKNLMSNILKTRKTVSNYILVKIIYIIITSCISFVLFFNFDPEWIKLMHNAEENGKATLALVLFIVGSMIGLIFIILLFWVFYKIIYGLLLKELHKKYQELKKMDL